MIHSWDLGVHVIFPICGPLGSKGRYNRKGNPRRANPIVFNSIQPFASAPSLACGSVSHIARLRRELSKLLFSAVAGMTHGHWQR